MATRHGARPRTIEDRRAHGEDTPILPLVVAGRPEPDELARPPRGLDTWARSAWREVVPQLVASKLIDRIDRHALEAYAVHLGRARAIREAIEYEHDAQGHRVRHKPLEEQFITRTQRGYTSNPLLSQEREALREARMMGELLGLNPVGRTRLVGRKPERHGLAGLQDELPRPRLAAVE